MQPDRSHRRYRRRSNRGTPGGRLNGGNSRLRVRATAAFDASDLPPRDLDALRLADRFIQLESRHFYRALFSDVSDTMLKRCLIRMTDRGLLTRFPRYVGGYRSGSGPYVYRVGPEGHKLLGKPGSWPRRREVKKHDLGVADYYITLLDGPAEVLSWLGKNEAIISVGGTSIQPDGRFELGNRETRTKTGYWLEYDRGSEHNHDQIRDKCRRYWHLAQRWQDGVFPYVLFVVPDERRKRFIERVIEAGPPAARQIFAIQVFDDGR